MMQFSVGCSLSYAVATRTSFVLNVEAAKAGQQRVLWESFATYPAAILERLTMPETGNRYMRIIADPGDLHITYQADVDLSPLRQDPLIITEGNPYAIPLNILPYLHSSRYCERDRLNNFAWAQFSHLPPGHSRVTAICNWICDNIQYISGSSDPMTSAFDTLNMGVGVCRDFAHLGIAICRALGIPSRYVSCYAWPLEPPDFHAVFEAWLQDGNGGRWYLFDPTRKAAPDGLVRIGIGRDAAEVSFNTTFGSTEPSSHSVYIRNRGLSDPILTTQAITLSEL